MNNYANRIFLQTNTKEKKIKKAIPGDITVKLDEIEYPKGTQIYFNMLNNQTNGFVSFNAFLRFFKLVSLYMVWDPLI